MTSTIARTDATEPHATDKPVQGAPHPKDAATLILLDRSGPTPKVLLGKRHASHKFMPGKFVFPGGRVDPADSRMPVARRLDPAAQSRLMKRVARPSPARAHAFALAAIRETFEETGLLLGVPVTEIPPAPKGAWQAFAQAKILPDLSSLYFIGRAITPPGRPRRFDARFFSLDATAIARRIEGLTGPDAELVELIWMSLPEAKQLDLSVVTVVMLEELELRLAEGLSHDPPVPFYRMPFQRFTREML
ncbi:MAG TPA: NUDIX hydrolase [Xanthobacteraceae bacterium]|jgi:8-oxo-dGTP pyrophosphatase MutT (NUDIX family)